ncbi:MAG: hypothetical protein IT236_02310 [Bacteroidia bacterium]|nr:hypothetical protein [Bacteroidia bacterium]
MIKKIYSILFLLGIYSGYMAQNKDSLFLETLRVKKKYRIANIEITGADNTDKNVISLLSGLSKGDEITVPGEKLQEAIKKLWKQGLFEDVQILKDKVIGNDIFLTIHLL